MEQNTQEINGKINYMWNFKPTEKEEIPLDVIENNSNYFKSKYVINPEDIDKIIEKDEFTKLKELYKIIPHWVVKADIGRLLYIYYNGGFYADVDCFLKKPITLKDTKDQDEHQAYVFIEKVCQIRHLGPREDKHPDNVVRISNFIFGASRYNPFLKEVIQECINRLEQLLVKEKITKMSNRDILWLCGPDVITTVYHKSKKNYNISILDRSYYNHKCFNSWKKN